MQTKRLHISGLTPAISERDLNSRFSIFGNVNDIHGVGQLNALGQPRNFAFVSLEATPEKISKCLNALSGSTWKGTQLRIGEARPDYREKRLLKDRMEPARPAKRRRLAHGIESKNMSIVTPENVDMRRGWVKTSLSHLVRPLRMRPLHPLLPPTTRATRASTSVKKKKQKVAPPTRARRRKIDPTLYGNVHMTEAMLQADHVVIQPMLLSKEGHTTSLAPKSPTSRTSTFEEEYARELHDTIPGDIVNPYEAEKERSLGLLAQLFDGKDRWEGREDLDDLDDLDDLMRGNTFPEVPREIDSAQEIDSQHVSDVVHSTNGAGHGTSLPGARSPVEAKALLKNLFASNVTEPMSILHGLDLDLDLEPDFAFDQIKSVKPLAEQQMDPRLPSPTNDLKPLMRRKGLEQVQISQKVPYFFPLDPHEHSLGSIKDVIGVSSAKGWMQPLLHPLTPDDARKKWESEKIALTRDWKQRHREASKRSRKGKVINWLE